MKQGASPRQEMHVRCCIVGGGPAGMVLGFLLARAARSAGARRLMLISAMGASARSVIFYLRVKGETEEALAALGYPALHIFRPGLLLGQRAEARPREALGMRWRLSSIR